MKPATRLALSLVTIFIQAPALAQQPRCEAVFAAPPHSRPTNLVSHRLSHALGLLNEQKRLLLEIQDSLDPEVVRNFIVYLEGFTVHLTGSESDHSTLLSVDQLGRIEARLARELDSMRSAASEIQAIRYPKDEIKEKLSEQGEMLQRLQEIERLWIKHERVSHEREIRLHALRTSGNDGKMRASAHRILKNLEVERESITGLLQRDIDGIALSASEKADLTRFFSDASLESVLSSILSGGSAVHLSPGARMGLQHSSSKEMAFGIYLDHLKSRHMQRLEREVSVTLEAYSAIAFKYYERLFPWGRKNKLMRHSDILDLNLRQRLLAVDSLLAEKTANLASDRVRLSRLFDERGSLLREIHSIEAEIEANQGGIGLVKQQSQALLALIQKFNALQSIETRIAGFFPHWSAERRVSAFLHGDLSKDDLFAALDEELASIRDQAAKTHEERESWLASHRTPSTDDDIELF